MNALLWVMTGSALGGMARLWVVNRITHRLGHRFPWGTLVVNASGALLIGLLSALLFGNFWPQDIAGWHFLVTGVLGSYTTVSSFSLQTLSLLRDGQAQAALANIVGSLVICLTMVALGYSLGIVVNGAWQ